MSRFILEVCVDSVESAKIAVEAGADRLEICANLANGGGITPSIGLVKCIASQCPEIPLMIMIRPRCGDFVYTDSELQVMKADIAQFKEIGITGVVLGVLTPEGTIDIPITKSLVEIANELQVTFHRAFDMTRDLDEALIELAAIPGISRVLTSGGGPTVSASSPQLEQLLKAAPPHLTVMPGSGVSSSSIQDILARLTPCNLQEIHMSGGCWVSGRSQWIKSGFGMGVSKEREWDVWTSSYESIQLVRMNLDSRRRVGVTAGRCVAEAAALNASIPRCYYSTNEIKDLIDQVRANEAARQSPNQQGGTHSDTSFNELVRERQSQRRGVRKKPQRRPHAQLNNYRLAREAFNEYKSEAIDVPMGPRQRQTGIIRTHTPELPPGDEWNIEPDDARFSAASAPSTGGRQKRPMRKGRGKRFGDENEEEVEGMNADVSEKDLESEELWDVDANAMRAFRRLTVWRNPVTGDEPGRPALFRSVKTGYDIFAEERTQFKLGDTTASWAGNRPTSSSQADVGGPAGEYGLFLPEKLKKLAGIDSTAMKPADLASLNLALSVNLTPREREDAAATIEEIVSRAQGTQNKQRI